jgi:hypothetical protein
MKITIHSYPRSGSNFLVNNLNSLLKESGIEIEKTLLRGLSHDPENFQVAVVREPVSTLISAYVHKEHFNKTFGGEFQVGILSYSANQYIRHLNTLEQYLDSLRLYRFEELDEALIDIASNFIEVPKAFVAEFPTNTREHLATSTEDPFYEKILHELSKHEYRIFDEAMATYNRIISNA